MTSFMEKAESYPHYDILITCTQLSTVTAPTFLTFSTLRSLLKHAEHAQHSIVLFMIQWMLVEHVLLVVPLPCNGVFAD
jgi:hypothetical protein